jgi:hypothetical protein
LIKQQIAIVSRGFYDRVQFTILGTFFLIVGNFTLGLAFASAIYTGNWFFWVLFGLILGALLLIPIKKAEF